MRILFENTEEPQVLIARRNIANVFNLRCILRELKQNYFIDAEVSPKRKWRGDIWYVTISAPYIGRVKDIVNPPRSTAVALFVNYADNTAFAMPRGGADKQTMMLIASIANKHIQEPFKCDSKIRSQLNL